MPKITKITIGRLFNLGNFEHVRYELAVEIPEGESATTTMKGLEKIINSLDPRRPAGVTTYAELAQEEERLKQMKEGGDPNDAEDIKFLEERLPQKRAALEEWHLRSVMARKLLDDLGGAATWTDAKLSWGDDDL